MPEHRHAERRRGARRVDSPAGALSPSALLHQARLDQRTGRVDQALESYGAAIAAAGETGERLVLADALRRLAILHYYRHDLRTARSLCQRSYVVAVAARDDVLAAEALNVLAGLELDGGDLEQARVVFQRAITLGGQSAELRSRVEQNLGIIANVQGNHTAALEHYHRSLEACQATGDRRGCAIAYHNLGMVSADQARWDDAESHYRQSRYIAESIGEVHLSGLCQLNHAEVHLNRGRYEDARRSAEHALAIFDQLGSQVDKSDAYAMLGMVSRESGRPALAEGQLLTAIQLAIATGSVLSEAEASRELARVYQAVGRQRDALTRLNRSYRLFGRLEARRDVVDAAKQMAQLDAVYREIALEWAQDESAGGTRDRVADLADLVSRDLGCTAGEAAAIRHGVYLRDVGKAQAPLDLLHKPGPMTRAEHELMRRHPLWALELLEGVDFPWDVTPNIRSHHEKCDGSGYPDRLQGASIPLGAQIICIADVYAALTSARTYRPAMTKQRALLEMAAHRRWWQPDVFDACMAAVA